MWSFWSCNTCCISYTNNTTLATKSNKIITLKVTPSRLPWVAFINSVYSANNKLLNKQVNIWWMYYVSTQFSFPFFYYISSSFLHFYFSSIFLFLSSIIVFTLKILSVMCNDLDFATFTLQQKYQFDFQEQPNNVVVFWKRS